MAAMLFSRHLQQSAACQLSWARCAMKGCAVDIKPVHSLWAVQALIRAATSLLSGLAVSEAFSQPSYSLMPGQDAWHC